MLAKTILVEELIEFSDCPAELPAGIGDDEKVIHIAGIVKILLVCNVCIHLTQMECRQ
ncbi:Uncharacterised protein [Budvicia aquatica]|uniref:Uncharacterized protein n=1 Tax=Budvicia aquatica TaxID=82979 RepID=A0A484ZTY4_9GAMM|nr:hypothetical protein [Budvicia aquatica]VFS51972.1 Uncharacterised protein [Budvicia aquatica]